MYLMLDPTNLDFLRPICNRPNPANMVVQKLLLLVQASNLFFPCIQPFLLLESQPASKYSNLGRVCPVHPILDQRYYELTTGDFFETLFD